MLQWYPDDPCDCALPGGGGLVACDACSSRRPYNGNWQTDAWYCVRVFDQELFAPNRELFLICREYLTSKSRDAFKRKYARDAAWFVQKIPRKLLLKRYRTEAIRRIDEFLELEGRK